MKTIAGEIRRRWSQLFALKLEYLIVQNCASAKNTTTKYDSKAVEMKTGEVPSNGSAMTFDLN